MREHLMTLPRISSTSSLDSLPPSLTSDDVEYYDYFYCDSPPSPPHTIEDQLHVAYAHDDIHLAKILLLKLQGIEVTSDDDPRIAAVQDEDFDVCFLPHGALLTEEEEQKAKDAQRMEQERRERLSWERKCQSIWENEKQRLRDEKVKIKMAKAKAEERRKRREQQEQEARHKVILSRTKKPKLSYESLSHSRASSSSSVVSFSITPSLDLPRRTRSGQRSTPMPLNDEQDVSPNHSSVSFEEVLSSMDGPLFPFSADRGHSRTDSSKSISTVKRTSRPDPLEILLDSDIIHREPRERRRRNKLAPQPRHCCVCRTSSMSSSLSSPSSDYSYSSGTSFSSSSTFSDITTPSTSPESISNMPIRKDVSGSLETTHLPPLVTTCRCRPPVSPLVTVKPTDHPLYTPPPSRQTYFCTPQSDIPKPSRNRRSLSRSNTPLGRLIQLAKGFQHAYLHAMVYSVIDYNQPMPAAPPPSARTHRVLQPKGYRASAELVTVFLSAFSSESDPVGLSMYVCLDGERRTTLPYESPYKQVFTRDVVPMPSPMQRFFHQTHLRELRAAKGLAYLDADPEEFGAYGKRPYTGTGGPKARLRIIQNPIWMQLKAFHGAVAVRGGTLDSPGLKRGPMAMGKEKMLSFTTEWNRRSLLCPNTRHLP